MTALAQIPRKERPRERLMQLGDEALSLPELLAICLGSGQKGMSVLSLAHALLARFQSLTNLFDAPVEALMEVKGIGQAKAIQLKAIFALAKRIPCQAGLPKYPMQTPRDAYHFIAPKLQRQSQELLAVMLRDAKGNIFYDEILSKGTLNHVLVHPREIFHLAIERRACSVIIAHNHPSGDATPSKSDLELTYLLVSSGKVLGIPLDDHLIIGNHTYTSLREENLL